MFLPPLALKSAVHTRPAIFVLPALAFTVNVPLLVRPQNEYTVPKLLAERVDTVAEDTVRVAFGAHNPNPISVLRIDSSFVQKCITAAVFCGPFGIPAMSRKIDASVRVTQSLSSRPFE